MADAPHTINVADLYTRIGSLEGRISEISSKMDLVMSSSQARLAALENDVDRLQANVSSVRTEVRGIQRFRYKLAAIGTVAGGVLGAAITYLAPIIRSITGP